MSLTFFDRSWKTMKCHCTVIKLQIKRKKCTETDTKTKINVFDNIFYPIRKLA